MTFRLKLSIPSPTEAVADLPSDRGALIAETDSRRMRLQRMADQIAPALNALRDAEAALDEARRRLGLLPVDELDWPSTLGRDALLESWRITACSGGRV